MGSLPNWHSTIVKMDRAMQSPVQEIFQEEGPSNFGRPRRVDHLRSGIQDQPDQHRETLSLLKIKKLAGSDEETEVVQDQASLLGCHSYSSHSHHLSRAEMQLAPALCQVSSCHWIPKGTYATKRLVSLTYHIPDIALELNGLKVDPPYSSALQQCTI
ncbi:hypothetical protein AAY473_025102 [Plecturocebus cupreus]